jgi:hypothetical protein
VKAWHPAELFVAEMVSSVGAFFAAMFEGFLSVVWAVVASWFGITI